MATKIQVRRDTAANWTANNPTLSGGEIGFETDTGKFKIGKSNTAWTSLQYAQVAGDDGLSYDIYPTVDSSGLTSPLGYSLGMNKSNIGDSMLLIGAETLFKAGDWVKAVYIDRSGSIGTANTIYPDVYFEGYIYNITKDFPELNYNNYYIAVTNISPGNQLDVNINEWTTGLLPEPKATYEFPPFIYPVGDPNAGIWTDRPDRPSSVGEEYTILGQPGLYQVGQKIRMQSLDEFGVAIAGDYSILEVLGIQKYIEGTQTDGLEVKCLEVYVDSNSLPYSSSFSLHASDGKGYNFIFSGTDGNSFDPAFIYKYELIGFSGNPDGFSVDQYVRVKLNETNWIEGVVTDIQPSLLTIAANRWSLDTAYYAYNNDTYEYSELSSVFPDAKMFIVGRPAAGYSGTSVIGSSIPLSNTVYPFAFNSTSPFTYYCDPGSYRVGDKVKIIPATDPNPSFGAPNEIWSQSFIIGTITSINNSGNSDSGITIDIDSYYFDASLTTSYDFGWSTWSIGLYAEPGNDGIGYKVQASSLTHTQSYESVQLGVSVWDFSEVNNYTVGDKVRLSRTVTINLDGTPTPEVEEIKGAIISLDGSQFELDVYYVNKNNDIYPSGDGPYDTDTNIFDVSLTADDGATGNPGIGYAKDAVIVSFGMPSPLYVGQTATIKFLDPITYDPIQHSYQVGNRIKLAQKSNTSNYAEGFVTQLGDPSGGPLAIQVVIDYMSNTVQTMFGLDASIILDGPTKGRGTFSNTNITIQDMGKYIYTSSGDPITLTVDVSANSVPHGSQVTIIQRWNGEVTISPSATSGTIYFAETDGLTEGTVTLKGIYSAATLVNAEGFWVVIGSFGSANPYVGA
jgi:hypothetical protein